MKSKLDDVDFLKKYLIETTRTKKHSAYQIIHKSILTLLQNVDYDLKPKYEVERINYIFNNVSFNDKSILDIGCNTGYFLFEMLDAGAKNVTGYEGGVYHYKFVETAIRLLKLKKKIKIINQYYDFENNKKKSDIVLLLNVLHHIGDDFGDKKLTLNDAKLKIIKQINYLSKNTSILIFQMGFNWQGNIKQCLFDNGLKSEMIEFIKNGTSYYWDIISIGIAVRKNGVVVYKDLDEKNIIRDDALGEFLNRPLFILKRRD